MRDTSILTNNGVNVQASLELFGDMEMYDETLGDFLDMSDEKISTLEQYKNANDMPNYAIAIHALKSDARYLGFTTLADLSYESEMKSKAGDSVYVAENHANILQEAKRVINLSQQYMGREITQVIPEGAAQAPVAEAAPAMEATPVMETAPVEPVMAQPEMVMQPEMSVQAPVMESAPVQTEMVVQSPGFTNAPASEEITANSIQFFPADDYNNDPMSQALFMQEQKQNSAPQVGAVKKGIILVVDDSPLVSNFVKKIFSSNYDVMIASDVQKAIDIINDDNIRSQIKTCLLDLNMPNVSGFDVMDYFKEKGFFVRTPVAIISGAEDNESLDKAKGYPIVDVLPKPFNERDVQRVVEKCLAVYF